MGQNRTKRREKVEKRKAFYRKKQNVFLASFPCF